MRTTVGNEPVTESVPPAGSRDTEPMPDRRVTCLDCGASRTFPDSDWETAQRAAIDAWARAHELAAHHGKVVSGWDVYPKPVCDRY